jgi:hypothetical protein
VIRPSAREQEIANNYAAFQKQLPSVLIAHQHQTALLRHGKIIGYFDKPAQAIREGRQRFSDQIFSVQKVEPQNETVAFGWYSHV